MSDKSYSALDKLAHHLTLRVHDGATDEELRLELAETGAMSDEQIDGVLKGCRQYIADGASRVPRSVVSRKEKPQPRLSYCFLVLVLFFCSFNYGPRLEPHIDS